MTGRALTYRRLDEVGFDVVDALFAKMLVIAKSERSEGDTRSCESTAARLTASELQVNEWHLRMWMRRQRTIAFLAETDADEILEIVAHGYTPADIAAEYDVSVRVIEEFIRIHCDPERVGQAKDAMADFKFSMVRRQIQEAKDEMELKRAAALMTVDRHVSQAHSKRYTEDKHIKLIGNAGAPPVFISFVRGELPRPPEAIEAKNEAGGE